MYPGDGDFLLDQGRDKFYGLVGKKPGHGQALVHIPFFLMYHVFHYGLRGSPIKYILLENFPAQAGIETDKVP